MRAGKLDKRVTLQRATKTDDGYSSEGSLVWNDLATVWCSIEQLSDGEKWRAGAVSSNATQRVVVRFSSVTENLTTDDRIAYRGRVFDILGIKPLGRNEGFELTCGEAK